MFTNRYKDLLISGYFDNPQCRVLWFHHGEVLPGYTFKSYRAAQLFITKLMQHQK